MALDLTGIQNVEFYSGHYLDAVLEGDLKSVFSRWAEREKDDPAFKAPHKTLASLSAKYFKLRSESEGEPSAIARWRLARDFHADLVSALGYEYAPSVEPLDGDEAVPVVLSLKRDGNPFLWVLDTGFPENEDDDPLDDHPHIEQLPADFKGSDLPNSTWRELLDERIFRRERPPRWVLVLSGTEALLTERNKWVQGKYLRFELGKLLGRKETAALRATAALLHRDVLAPADGLPLHDTLDENSHKHAYAVSGDLKHGVRRAVELLANEAVWYRREVQKKGVFEDEEFASKLSAESLTWLYRLLFLFYVEARGAELGIVPMDSDAYREGYSLEALRDLELVPLIASAAQDGFYIHESLRKLFGIVNMGFPAIDLRRKLAFDEVYHNTMKVDALNSPLFSDDRLDVLRGVKFRNFILQEILQLLSLSAERKRKSRGRISYAQLGINQLGAVYEGLLSYTGFFATEDLYEVASEKDNKKLSGKPAAEREALKTYFVPASRIGDYKEGEIVRDENEKKVVHRKGSFIFRLAGRNREKSASYYTPEVLTQCLVKYALKELLWEEGEEGAKPTRKKTADEILALTICEPAMGSSAFLIEAVDQLADAYLEAKQEELDTAIPPEKYQYEKRRVKARLATNNCYGVDLNPTAVELAKVSLWLATLHEDGKCPWFGLRLATGNSLVGARREVFKTADVMRRGTKDNPNWLGLVPEPVPLHHGNDAPPPDEVDWANWTAPPRPKGTIYHFLLPAEGMAAFDKDKVIKQLAPESVKRIKEWRKEFCKPFNKKDAERLEQISDAVDRLFAQVVRERVLATQETSDCIPVWGEPPSAQQADLLVRDQEEVAASLEDGSSAYRRLKLAMDTWCALWFWPVEEAGLLPDRATWLAQMELILKGQVTSEEVWQQRGLFAEMSGVSQGEPAATEVVPNDITLTQEASAARVKRLQRLSAAFRDRRADYFDVCGLADINTVVEGDASLRSAQDIANRQHFHHWLLRFAEVFAWQGGFDLILGNPPWVKVEWDEKAFLSDSEAIIDVRGVGASAVAGQRSVLLQDVSLRSSYLLGIAEVQGLQQFLSSQANYRRLRGVHTNLYKCFVARSLTTSADRGIAAFLHPEGLYEDPGGSEFRAELYPRLRSHFQFINEANLFADVHHRVKFSICVYEHESRAVQFVHVSNLYHPHTVDASFAHDGRGQVPGLKDLDGNFEFSPHFRRIVVVGQEDLELFAGLYDPPGRSGLEARLPVLHSAELLDVLRRIASGEKVGPQSESWVTTREWNEADRKQDGVLQRSTHWATDPTDWVVQGPHFFVATPLNKTPNATCENNLAYTTIDLLSIEPEYLPRSNYTQDRSCPAYIQKMPVWNGRRVFDFPRYAHRAMVAPSGERSLVPCILPIGAPTVHGVFTATFDSTAKMVEVATACSSILLDFFVKTLGKTGLGQAEFREFPIPVAVPSAAIARCLMLNCIASHYSSVWADLYREEWTEDRWVSVDPRLRARFNLGSNWSPQYPCRTDLERRQALVEIDVLIAHALGATLDELAVVFRIQFPVLQQYERERRYDQVGRIVPNSKTASGQPAASLIELATTLKEQAGFDVHAEYHPNGASTQDLRREKIRLNKRDADVLGVSERCAMADLLAETEVRWSDEDHPEGRPVRLVGLRYTDPGLEPRMERVYPTPWTRCDRVADYRQAWDEFERRLGKKMPERNHQ